MLQFDQLSFWEKESYINHTDFLVVGAGIVGLSTAIYLKERNPTKKVTVLERGYLPTGASSKNAGFACIGSPSEILSDLKHTDESLVYETIEKRWKGLNNLFELLGKNQIDYQHLGSFELFRKKDQQNYSNCIAQLDDLNQRIGDITGISQAFKSNDNAINDFGYQGFQHAIEQSVEGQLNPAKMMHELHLKAVGNGINTLYGINVQGINQQNVITNYGPIAFQNLAICVNGFASQFLPDIDLTPARAQVLVTAPIPNLKIKGTFHFDEGYYYFRNIGNRVLFGGGRSLDIAVEHTNEISLNNKIQTELGSILATHILPNTSFQITDSWAGIMGVGQKKAPIIQKVDDHIYCGVRLGGMGVAIGSLVGKELAELMSN